MNDDNMMDRQENAAEDFGVNEMAQYLDGPDHALRQVKRGEVVEGTVVAIDREEVLVDIGLKSEAVLPLKELSSSGYGSMAELHVNDPILVFVLQPETPEGHAVVSVKKARQEHQWRVAQEMYERGDLIDAEVIEHNKGGLIVNLSGVRGFVPISQIMNLKREDSADNAETLAKLQAMVGKTLKLKIIEINRSRNRLILSERLAMQEWRARRRDELLGELQVNEVRRGVVSNLAAFGAFVDLGGADGLVHISQLAWSRVNHPSEVLHIGQEVEVQVLSIDKERKKIALSIKRAEIDPWLTVDQRYTPDQIVTGVVTKLAPFGAFARVENGIEGLIHVTEIYPPTNDPKAVLKEGQEVQVRILRIESERRRLGLSMKAVAAPDAAVPASASDSAATVTPEPAQSPAGPESQAVPVTQVEPEMATQQAATTQPASSQAPTSAPEPPPTTALGAAFDIARSRQQVAPAQPAAPSQAVAQPETTATPEPAATAPAVEDEGAPAMLESTFTAKDEPVASALEVEVKAEPAPDTSAVEAKAELVVETQEAEVKAEPAQSKVSDLPLAPAQPAAPTPAADVLPDAEVAADAVETTEHNGKSNGNGHTKAEPVAEVSPAGSPEA